MFRFLWVLKGTWFHRHFEGKLQAVKAFRGRLRAIKQRLRVGQWLSRRGVQQQCEHAMMGCHAWILHLCHCKGLLDSDAWVRWGIRDRCIVLGASSRSF
jgi:hypothetical protein